MNALTCARLDAIRRPLPPRPSLRAISSGDLVAVCRSQRLALCPLAVGETAILMAPIFIPIETPKQR